MAQNFLRPDVPADMDKVDITPRASGGDDLRICYDGQMANWGKGVKINGFTKKRKRRSK